MVADWLLNTIWGRLSIALVGLLAIGAIVRLVRRFLEGRVSESERRHQARKAVSFIAYVVALAFLVVVFSRYLGNVTVALGIAGAGVAFALQEVIMSLAGWLANVVGHFYKTGDRIRLAGITGDVIEIAMLRTTLMECGEWVKGDLYNGRIVRVANSFVFKEPVFNYTADFPFLWDEIVVPITFGSDREQTRRIIQQAAQDIVGDYAQFAKTAWKGMVQKYLIEDARVEPLVTMVANDNWLEFTLRYVVDYKFRRSTKDKLFSRILDDIDKTEGKVRIASAGIALVEMPPLDVRVSERGRKGESL